MAAREQPSLCCAQSCKCLPLAELTELHQRLRSLREAAERTEAEVANSEFRLDAREVRLGEAEREAVRAALGKQREIAQYLAETMRRFRERLDREQEEASQVDRELAELENQVCAIKSKCDKSNNHFNEAQFNNDKTDWCHAVELEIEEQTVLKNKIDSLNKCLDLRIQEEETKEKCRQEERRMDAKYLVDTIDYIDTIVKNAKAVIHK